MKLFFMKALLLLCVASVCFAEFKPSVTVKSCTEEKIVVTLTDAAEGGIVYVQGRGSACKQITTQAEKDHEFDYLACNIKFEDQFRLVVQKKALYQTGEDQVIPVMCMVDTSDIVVSAGFNVNDKDADEGQNITIKTTGHMKLFRAGVDVTGGDVKLSDVITMEIGLHDNFRPDFDIKARECTASTIPIMGEFCATDIDLFPNFVHPTQGLISAEFGVFRPTDLAGGRVAITFSCTLTVCRGACDEETCPNKQLGWGRRKRDVSKRDVTEQSQEDITVGTTLRILADDVIIEGNEEDDQVCMNSLAFVIIVVALVAGLVASSSASAVLLRRLYLRNDQLDKMAAAAGAPYQVSAYKPPFSVDSEKAAPDNDVTITVSA